jgi:DNA-binding response OmpR family regulator
MMDGSSEEVAAEARPALVSLVAVVGASWHDVTEELSRQALEWMVRDLGDPLGPLVLVWIPAGMTQAALGDLVRRLGACGARRMLACASAGGPVDCERALRAGFDDVVAGRASPRELAGRLHALARRLGVQGSTPTPAATAEPVRFGAVTVDLREHGLWVDGRAVTVSRTELRIMETLARARGQCRSRGDLLDAVWGDGGLERSERAVDNVVLRLRRKLPDPGVLVTVRGVGFRLRDH